LILLNFIFSLIQIQIVYEHPNSNYRHYIQLDFNVTKIGKKNSFSILTSKSIKKKKNTSSLNIEIKRDANQNSDYNIYSLVFDDNKTEAKVSLKLDGGIFGGNKYYKEFLLYLDIKATEQIKKKIKIQPIFNAVKNVSLLDKSKLFIIQKDNPYYRQGEPVSADKLQNLFLRFIDLEKKETYQTHIVLLSILLGVLLSVLISILSTIMKSYIESLKLNKE